MSLTNCIDWLSENTW